MPVESEDLAGKPTVLKAIAADPVAAVAIETVANLPRARNEEGAIVKIASK